MKSDLIDALLVDLPHTSRTPVFSRKASRKELNLEQGVWYLQKVPDACSNGKKCQASYSSKTCDKTLQKGTLVNLEKVHSKISHFDL